MKPYDIHVFVCMNRRDPSDPRGCCAEKGSEAIRDYFKKAVKARGEPGNYAILLPLNEYEPLLALALQQSEPLLRDGGRYGNFRSAGFARAHQSLNQACGGS